MECSLLPRREVEKRCGLSRASIYAGMAKKKFPRPVKLPSGRVRWRSTEIDDFINGLKHAEYTTDENK